MKTSTALLAFWAVIALLLCGCQTPRTTTSVWEYKVIEKNLYPGELQKQIDTAAHDGWEFVSFSTTFQEGAVPLGHIIVRRPKR